MIFHGNETLEVVGESFYQEALWSIVGGETSDPVREGIVAVLEPEPTNPHDPNAIQIKIDDQLVGYLSREDAAAYVPGLRRLIEGCETSCVGLQGVVVGGGWRGDRIGYLGVFLNHDPASFGVTSHHATMLGTVRTGYSQARATDLEDDSYDLSWSDFLSDDDWAAAAQLRRLLEAERDPIDRHFMFAELSRRLYRCRDAHPDALKGFDETCHQHDLEMHDLRPVLLEKFGAVPMIQMYRQAAIRCQKSKDWEQMKTWAERGIAVYGDRPVRPEDLADLQKRAAYAIAKLQQPKPPAVGTASTESERHPSAQAMEWLTCESCGSPFQRPLARGRKPKLCPDCRQRRAFFERL